MGDISTPLASLNCKIEQGIDTLKSFIYLTNEYGVPSVSYIDDFISNFGHDIVTGQFRYSKLDGFWETVKDDCEKNKVQYKEVYGSLFYELVPKYLQVVTKGWSEEEKKDLISSEKDKLDLLKDFISNFDKYILEGLDMQEVYLENTPELIKKDENGEEYIDVHINWHNRRSLAHLYRDRVLLLKGSYIHELSPRVMTERWGQKLLVDREKHTDGKYTTVDLEFKSPSGAGNYVIGHEVNGYNWWKNDYEHDINKYRYKKDRSLTVPSIEAVKAEPIKVVQNKISVEPVKPVENTEKNAGDTVKTTKNKDKYVTSEAGGLSNRIYIENTPDLIQTDENGNKYILLHCTKEKRKSYARLYSNGYMMLLRGSAVRYPSLTYDNINKRNEVIKIYNNYVELGLLKENILFKSSAIATSLVLGISECVWNCWLNSNNDSIRVYREPLKNPISTYKNPVTSSKIPRYRLKAQYCSNGSQSLLGRELRLDGKFFGLIIGDTQAKIDGKAYDLSIYIYKNKIDISRLSIFVAPFLAAYELVED